MNYLAHFHLAGDNDGLMVGALLGDFIKGPLTAERTEPLSAHKDIVLGVKLHRKIDAYVDHLPALLTLGNQLPIKLRRYKGILLDLFCDYALSHYWHQFDHRPLEQYTLSVLTRVEQYRDCFNPAADDFFGRMVQYDLLNNYQQADMLNGIIHRIGQRLNRVNELDEAASHMWRLEEQWLESFSGIYQQIENFAEAERTALLHSAR